MTFGNTNGKEERYFNGVIKEIIKDSCLVKF